MKIKKSVMLTLSILPLLVTLVMLLVLPDQVPAHYDKLGAVTRWGSKYEMLTGPVLTAAFMGIFYGWFCRSAKAGKEKLTLNAIFIGAIIVGIAYNCVTYSFLCRAMIASML